MNAGVNYLCAVLELLADGRLRGVGELVKDLLRPQPPPVLHTDTHTHPSQLVKDLLRPQPPPVLHTHARTRTHTHARTHARIHTHIRVNSSKISSVRSHPPSCTQTHTHTSESTRRRSPPSCKHAHPSRRRRDTRTHREAPAVSFRQKRTWNSSPAAPARTLTVAGARGPGRARPRQCRTIPPDSARY